MLKSPVPYILEQLQKSSCLNESEKSRLLLKGSSSEAMEYGLQILLEKLETSQEKEKSLYDLIEQLESEQGKRSHEEYQKLKESEERFQKAFQTSAAAISITRLSDSRYLDVNDAFVKMTGFSKEECLNKTSLELGLVVSIEKREEILKHIKEYGSARDFEMTIENKDGKIVEILASVETIFLNEEKYALNVIYDITNRKRTAEQLATLNNELESFTYSVSHDLRAPLRAVHGYSQMLKEDYGKVLDAEGNRVIEIIQDNAIRMGVLIDDLLSFSRLGRKEIVKTDIEMNSLVDSVINEITRNQNVAALFKIKELHDIKADYSLLYQVITNLVSNAIKYSSKVKQPEIEISSEEKESEIFFKIKDNGAGFDMKYSDKLFGVFQRLHSQEEFEGTGVGLAIVHRIIIKHGGRIWAEGKPNEGATFYFSLAKK